MKKTLLRTLISTAIIVALPIGLISASAGSITSDSTTPTSGTSTVTATASDTYTVTIPDSYAFGTVAVSDTDSYSYVDGTVTVTKLSIDPTKSLKVTFGDDNADTTANPNFTMTHTTDTAPKATIPFKMYSAYTGSAAGTEITAKTVGLTVNKSTDPTTGYSAPCDVGINLKDIKAAGDYSGVLTFSMKVE